MRIINLQPTLSHDEAEKKFKGRYLTRADYDERPEDSVRGVLPNGKTAFIFLREFFEKDSARDFYRNVLSKLKFSDAEHSRRPGLKKSKGGEMLMGWVNFPSPRPAAPSKKQMALYWEMFVVTNTMKAAIRKYLPEYYEQQMSLIAEQFDQHPWLDIFKHDKNFYANFKPLFDDAKRGDAEAKEVRDNLIPMFSTLTINKSTVFRAHADAKNQGGLACLAAYGTFSGGDFCLPRLRVAFPLSPGDLLIADNNNEQHGNIGPLSGTRISVVAYLRAMTKAKAAKAGV